jgi:uncharacterized membrane protein
MGSAASNRLEWHVFARYLVTWIVPLSIIALAIPLILEKVPRNIFYGFRTPLTLSADKIWYRANRICGIAFLLGGVFWLLLALLLPSLMSSSRSADRMVVFLGSMSLIVGCLVSLWLTYRRGGSR